MDGRIVRSAPYPHDDCKRAKLLKPKAQTKQQTSDAGVLRSILATVRRLNQEQVTTAK